MKYGRFVIIQLHIIHVYIKVIAYTGNKNN